MSGSAVPVTDERHGLLTFLELQRHFVRTAAHGLTDAQAAAAPSASALSIGGLVRHLAFTERGWMADVTGSPAPEGEWGADFAFTAEDSLGAMLADYDAAAAETTATVTDLALDAPVVLPDMPWFPHRQVSVRWVLLHLIEETARHAGHADIVRETLDGATWYTLMAANGDMPAGDRGGDDDDSTWPEG